MSSLHCRNKSAGGNLCKISSIVGCEGDTGERLGDVGVGAAEAVDQLLAELGPVGIAHNGGRHSGGPTHVIVSEEIQKLVYLLSLEAADIAVVVNVSRRGADQNEALEQIRILERGENPNHCADRVPDENSLREPQATSNLDHVIGITRERRVFGLIIRLEIRSTCADVI